MPSIIDLYPNFLKGLIGQSDEHPAHFHVANEGIISPISLEEVLTEEPQLLMEEMGSEANLLNFYEVIEEMYQAPPEAGGAVQKSGSSTPLINKQNPYPLHHAAAKGDVVEIQRLIKQGHNVNQEDDRSATALVAATIFGKTQAVQALIKAGVVINDRCYEGQTALHIAVDRKQYGIARQLVENGADPRVQTAGKLNVTTMLFGKLEAALQLHNEAPDSAKLKSEVIEILKTFETFARIPNSAFLTYRNKDHGVYQLPLSVALKSEASKTKSTEINEYMTRLSDTIANNDPLTERIIHAKNLLISFPNGKSYAIDKIKMGDDPLKIIGDGYYKQYTTSLVRDSLKYFLDNLKKNGADQTKIDIFTKIHEAFENAAKWTLKAFDPATANEAFAAYQAGKTVLLPSQWTGHCVDEIISKKQALTGIANAGDRYAYDKPGVNLDALHEPEAIDASYMHDILTNKDRIYLELYMKYLHGPVSKEGVLESPSQVFGNCTLEAHRNAVKGIAFIECRNAGLSKAAAEKLSSEFFGEWDKSHGHYVIEQYLSHSPILPANALGDIYLGIQKKKGNGDFTKMDSDNAHLLENALNSQEYAAATKSWVKGLPAVDAQIVKANFSAQASASSVPYISSSVENDASSWNPFKFLGNLFGSSAALSMAHVHDAVHHPIAVHTEAHAGLEMQPHLEVAPF